jgi:hypothetical protein
MCTRVVKAILVPLSKQKYKNMSKTKQVKQESFKKSQKRQVESKDEVNNLIHTSEWVIDEYEGYDEKEGWMFITLVKKIK